MLPQKVESSANIFSSLGTIGPSKPGYFEDPNPAIQVQTLPLEGPRSLGMVN